MTGFDYGNARLRAMKSRLLPRGRLEALAEMGSIPALIAALTETPYRSTVDAALARASGPAVISRMILLDARETYSRLSRFYQETAWRLLRLVLRRSDVHNVKCILRGLSRSAAPETIAEVWSPPAELDEPLLLEMVRAGEPRAAIDRMAALRLAIARPLLELRQEHPGSDHFDMEVALSRWYYQRAWHDLGREKRPPALLGEYLARQADLDNLLVMLRFAHDPAERSALGSRRVNHDLAGLLVENGQLSLRLLQRVGEQNSVADAVELLAQTPFGEGLAVGLGSYRHSRRLSDIEIELQRAHLRWKAALIRKDPLGVGVPLGFLALKMNELANLGWITRGVQSGLSPGEIKAGLL